MTCTIVHILTGCWDAMGARFIKRGYSQAPLVINCIHTAESKRRLLAKCNASRRQIVNFFINLSKYRLKKGLNVQFMSNKGVHGTIVHLTNLHT